MICVCYTNQVHIIFVGLPTDFHINELELELFGLW